MTRSELNVSVNGSQFLGVWILTSESAYWLCRASLRRPITDASPCTNTCKTISHIAHNSGTVTHDMLRIDLLDKARILRKVDVRTERNFVDGHPALDLLAVHADKVFRLFE